MSLIHNKNISPFYKALLQHKDLLIKVYAGEIGYTPEEVEALWEDMDHFFKNLSVSLEGRKKLWAQEAALYHSIESSFTLRRCGWGNILFVPPVNSIIPTLPIVITSAIAMGNSPFILHSRRCPQTFMLFRSICNKVMPEVVFLEKEDDFNIEKVFKDQQIDLLLYQGGSHHFPSLLNACANQGVYPILEGSGQTLSIIESGDDDLIKTYATKIAHSKLFCKGSICSSPNLVFIPQPYIKAFTSYYSNILVKKYQEKDGQISANEEQLGIKLNALIGDDWEKPVSGVITVNIQEAIKLLNEDLNGMVAICIPYNNIGEVRKLLSLYRYGLQISFYSSSSESSLYTELKARNNVSRITRNKLQIEQKSILPWGGYRLSGISKVQDYFEKFTKTITIED
ncbi:aldehyde dehydrogenase family protein [Fulvivirga sp. 29W222]|uniref:Aldehyde dehydrogenase family protein n=1 Tax=Fulvivirga marina TaxID=2494733 RepID=A0A937G1L0_9BACT|nr:aldehyde dehydrogenase family protein [Fulvivirga marina]MBL6448388.1 aldehyde dehydrogenase family protein [Fulvivirga marina]